MWETMKKLRGTLILSFLVFLHYVQSSVIDFGLHDYTTYKLKVNKVFDFHIIDPEWQKFGFTLEVEQIPVWLTYNQSEFHLYGIPGKLDIGSHILFFYLNKTDSCTGNDLEIKITVEDISINQDSCKYKPVKKDPVDHIHAVAGKPFLHQLSEDVFEDVEDGSTRKLDLDLISIYSENTQAGVPWLLLDTANHTLYGLPLQSSATEVMGLSATDSCGLKDVDAISVNVESVKRPHYEFVMYLTTSSFNVMKQKTYQYRFVTTLQSWLQQNIQILTFNPTNRSVTWILADDGITDRCDGVIINSTKNKLTTDNGTILPELNCHFSPYFKVYKTEIRYLEICYLTVEHVPNATHLRSDFRYWLEVIVPALIFIVLFITLVIFLYSKCGRSRKKRGKYILNDEEATFMEERQPVILQSENPLDDSNLQPKSPIIISPADDSTVQRATEVKKSGPAIPEVMITPESPPPQYRLPPPYNNQHQFW